MQSNSKVPKADAQSSPTGMMKKLVPVTPDKDDNRKPVKKRVYGEVS